MNNLLCQNVGVDVSKDALLDVVFSTLDLERRVKVKASRTFANTPAGFKQLQRWLESKRAAQVELRILMEATGVYYEQLAWFLYQQGYQVSVVLPTKAKRYLQALGHRSKNDQIDAKGLAQMGLEQRLELWQPLSPNIYQLEAADSPAGGFFQSAHRVPQPAPCPASRDLCGQAGGAKPAEAGAHPGQEPPGAGGGPQRVYLPGSAAG